MDSSDVDDEFGKGRRKRRRTKSDNHSSMVPIVSAVILGYLGLLPIVATLARGSTVATHAASLYDKMTGITRVCLVLGILLLVLGLVVKIFPITSMALTVAGINPPMIGIGLLLFWYFGSDYTVATSQMIKGENVHTPTISIPLVPPGYILPGAFLLVSAWNAYRVLHV